MFVDIGLFLAALGALCYWVFVAPGRSRRRRHSDLGEPGGRGGSWDPRIYDGRRNR